MKKSSQLIISWIGVLVFLTLNSCISLKLKEKYSNNGSNSETSSQSKNNQIDSIAIDQCEIFTVSTRKGQVFLGPGTEYGLDNILLEQSEKVALIKTISKWVYVYIIKHQKAGWMHTGFLASYKNPLEKLSIKVPLKYFDSGSVAVASANVRQGPGLQHPETGHVKKNEKIKILQKSEEWNKIWIPSMAKIAWIKKELVYE